MHSLYAFLCASSSQGICVTLIIAVLTCYLLCFAEHIPRPGYTRVCFPICLTDGHGDDSLLGLWC